MNTKYQFMADFSLPAKISKEFKELIPFQKLAVDRFLAEGKLISYALSMEQSKLWAVFSANSEAAVLDMIADLPLSKYMKVNVSMLSFYKTLNPNMPIYSLN